MMIARPALLKSVRDGLKANPVVALLGPRQCGKTTFARGLAETVTTSYFDLENPADLPALVGVGPRRKASVGAKISFARSWSETCRNWAWACRPPRCADSGQCLPITRALSGTPRRSGARSAERIPLFGDTSTCFR